MDTIFSNSRLLLRGYSVAPVKLPTEFAELNADLSTYEKEYVDCSGCENVDAPKSVLEYLSKAITAHPELIWDHWNPQDKNLRGKIAKLHGVDVDQVMITSGAMAGIEYVFKIFTKEGTKTGFIKPEWPGFEHYADFNGNEKHYLESFEFPFAVTAEQIGRFVQDNAIEFMVFANPVPVQGHCIAKKDIEKLLQENPQTLFLIDEADTVTPQVQSAELAAKHENVIFLGSLSKFYGLSGLRIGYLIAPKMHVEHFRNTINVIEVSSLAILAGNIVMDDMEYQRNTQKHVAESIEILQKAFKGTSYRLAASPYCFAGYIYSKENNPTEELQKLGIKILAGQYFGLPPGINGGRFNLANPSYAKLIAEKLGGHR